MLCLYCRSRKGGCRHCNPNHPDYAHNHHDHKQEEVDQLRAENAELLESLGDVLSLALLKWGNLDPDANKVFDAAHAAIAKATAKGK